ncbi:hypothetical protein HAHE_22900 [Haloferula helveola]|uniref:peptidylprolyl isomerase n=1 Tax=Haloferula helveola TaxID=490095 RepID=A0ABM7RF85_9BACT|nr:hypothetical protein HAHE_22900 [Haloferula helveola]
MRPSKSFTIRVFLYSAGLIYLALDLFVFNGPVNRRIQDGRPDSQSSLAYARKQGVVARVMGIPIYLSQVERAARERLWLTGKTMDDLEPEQRRTTRLAALNDLIDHELLRMKVRANQQELPVTDEEIDAAVKRLASRFPTREQMRADLEAEGIDSEEELRLRLGATIQQSKYIESQIADGIAVSEEEAAEWFAENRERFALPPRVKVRHVFVATLNRESEDAKGVLEEALGELRAKTKTFEQLAAEVSEDERNKRSGGDLGWMTGERIPADFSKPVFAMQKNQPRLIRTKIGWHLVEVTDKRAAEPRNFEEARDEVFAALQTSKRIEIIANYRKALREGRGGVGIHVFHDMITGE